jgi:predicted helicase
MDDEKYFGYLLDEKTIFWAIENKKITDYNVLVIKNTEEEVTPVI